MSEEAPAMPEKEFQYQGPAGALIFWFIWSVVGYGFLTYQGEPFSLLDLLYLVSCILAVMALNNRKFGINHRIRFFEDKIVVPKILNVWHPQEEEIFFNDILQVNFHDHAKNRGMDSELDFCEIEILTEDRSYPILGRKLKATAFREIYDLLQARARSPRGQVSASVEEIENLKESTQSFGLTAWQKKLGIMAIVVSFATIGIISVSTPFHSLIGGARFFAIGFLASCFYCWWQFKKIKVENTGGRRWQKIFLLLYIAFYGGIGGSFSLIYLNGMFDSSNDVVMKVKVLKIPFVTSVDGQKVNRKAKQCVELAPVQSARAPASDHLSKIYSNQTFTLCRPEMVSFKKGQTLNLKTRKGFLGEVWISDLVEETSSN